MTVIQSHFIGLPDLYPLVDAGPKMNMSNNTTESLEDAELSALGITVLDQSTLERNVQKKVDAALAEHKQKQKLNILERELRQVSADIAAAHKSAEQQENKLQNLQGRIADPKRYITAAQDAEKQQATIDTLNSKLDSLKRELAGTTGPGNDVEEGEILEAEQETELERLIREGEITPFSAAAAAAAAGSSSSSGQQLRAALTRPSPTSGPTLTSRGEKQQGAGLEQYFKDQLVRQQQHAKQPKHSKVSAKHADHPSIGAENRNRKRTRDDSSSSHGIGVSTGESKPLKLAKRDVSVSKSRDSASVSQLSLQNSQSPLKKNVLHPRAKPRLLNVGSSTSNDVWDRRIKPGKLLSESTAFEDASDDECDSGEGSDYVPSDGSDTSDDYTEEGPPETGDKKAGRIDCELLLAKTKQTSKAKKKKKPDDVGKTLNLLKKHKDDSNFKSYQKRLERWKKSKLKAKQQRIIENDGVDDSEDDKFIPVGELQMPNVIWKKLYRYQQTGVQWLSELHSQGCGGILGDEMGLGKTVMMISFLAGLRCSSGGKHWTSQRGLGPVLVLCPATLLHQWLRHFHDWWPPFRVAILHSSGGYSGNMRLLMHNINKDSGVLITSYTGARAHMESLLKFTWHYVILDEGHKIRNPEAQITLAVKQFNTPHRLILSGSPIQNSLKELWSLFDFVFPGKLGTLQVFLQQFAVPITQGGYANASRVEVETGFKCAVVLRDTINPYLLRRMKADVKSHLTLPDKSEQVLFCGLTDEQRSLYKSYLDGDQVSSMLNGRLKVFVGLMKLRKLCNHPDLFTGGPQLYPGETLADLPQSSTYGWWERSGKMQVVHGVLQLWHKQGHRVLLFSQSSQMLSILENYLQQQSYSYLKMTGKTPVGARHGIVQNFNSDPNVFVFLLTTRVGGLGVNLTGANRVVIFDPDWNPSTDTQARERAWRIGQLKNVTIYRLLTAGTIEEKIYHRQIFKQFLTNRVLKDPKQQRFFKTNDLFELFSLNEGEDEKTESSALFAGLGSEITPNSDKHSSKPNKHKLQVARKNNNVKKSAYKKEKRNNVSSPSISENSTCSSKETFDKGKGPDKKKLLKSTTGVGGETCTVLNSLPDVGDQTTTTENPILVSSSSAEMLATNQMSSSPVVEVADGAGRICTNIEDAAEEVVKSIPEQADVSHSEVKEVSDNDGQCLALQAEEDTSDARKLSTDSNIVSQPVTELPASTVPSVADGTSHMASLEVESDTGAHTADAGDDLLAREESPALAPSHSGIGGDTSSSLEEDEKRKKMRLLAKILSQKMNSKSVTSAESSQPSQKTEKQKLSSKKEKKSYKEKGAKFEGERLKYLVKERKYRSNDDKAKEQEKDKSNDNYVLSKLFKSSGVHTALSHDAIVGSNDADYLLLESEAERVAKDALKIVRASRSQCFRPSLQTRPTVKPRFRKAEARSLGDKNTQDSKTFQTGDNHDSASESTRNSSSIGIINARSGQSSSGKMSSAQLLALMKSRRTATDELGSDSDDDDGSRGAEPAGSGAARELDPTTAANVDLLSDIRNFVAFQAERDGQATTQEILDRFRQRLPGDRTHVFKALLRQICHFRKDPPNEGVWYMKPEFQ